MDFCGDSGRGGGTPRALAGEEEGAATVVAAFCRLGGTRGTSWKLPGWSDWLDDCDRLEELLDAFRRLSLPWPATKETRSGDDGCEALLGDELAWLNPEGD